MQTNTNNPDDINKFKSKFPKLRIREWVGPADDVIVSLSVLEEYLQAQEQRHQVEVVRARIKETELWYTDWGNGKERVGDGSWEDFYEHRKAILKAQLNTLTTTVDKERTDE